MKILHVAKSLRQGGIETMVADVTRYSSGYGCENTVLTFASPPQLIGERITAAGTPVHYASIDPAVSEGSITNKDISSGEAAAPYCAAITEAVKLHKPDAIMCWDSKSSLLCGRMKQMGGLKKIPLLWTVHCDDQREYLNPKEWQDYVASANLPVKIIYTSQSSMDKHIQLGLPKSSAVFVPNAVDMQAYDIKPRAGARMRDELDIAKDDLVLIFAARYAPMKDVPSFVAACREVLKQRPDCKIIMCGNRMDSGNDELLEMIGPDAASFRLLGERGDMPALFNAADIMVSTSRYGETTSKSLIEALACGCAVVATPVGDAPFAVRFDGRMTEAGNPTRIAHDILDVSHELDRDLMRQRVSVLFHIEDTVYDYVRIFREAVADGVAPTPPDGARRGLVRK